MLSIRTQVVSFTKLPLDHRDFFNCKALCCTCLPFSSHVNTNVYRKTGTGVICTKFMQMLPDASRCTLILPYCEAYFNQCHLIYIISFLHRSLESVPNTVANYRSYILVMQFAVAKVSRSICSRYEIIIQLKRYKCKRHLRIMVTVCNVRSEYVFE